MMPKLSIITINYNNLEGLKKTIESVSSQTCKEFEYLIIDGGSTDGSVAYIESKSDAIDYWISEPDKGIYNAMNKGIELATGEYILFINSGDHLFSDKAVKSAEKYLQSYDVIYFNLQIISEDNRFKIHSLPDKLKFSDFFIDSWPHPSTFTKRELFDKVGLYDENLKIFSDWKFMILALFKYQCSYLKVDEILSTFYLGGISSQTDLFGERNQVLKEFFNGYVLDYEELYFNRKIVSANRFKMLQEIERTVVGKKLISLLFRVYIVLFSKRKLKDIID
nr:glycosyltransferase family 2 protein [uncultured Flavobacterium sp.]